MRKYKSTVLYILALLVMPYTLKSQSLTGSPAQKSKWFIPDAAVLQYAGNMGMLAAGPGYELANEKLQLDALYGYVPKFQGTKAGHLITLKSTLRPFKLALNEIYTFTPLQAGLGVSYHFGSQYSIFWEEPFPEEYYWWSTRIRLLGFAGTSLSRKVEGSFVNEIGAYAEVGTYELLVTAWYKDDKLRLWDIMSASLGVRLKF